MAPTWQPYWAKDGKNPSAARTLLGVPLTHYNTYIYIHTIHAFPTLQKSEQVSQMPDKCEEDRPWANLSGDIEVSVVVFDVSGVLALFVPRSDMGWIQKYDAGWSKITSSSPQSEAPPLHQLQLTTPKKWWIPMANRPTRIRTQVPHNL